MSIRKITAAVTLSLALVGIGASAASAGDPSQWGRARAEVAGDPSQWGLEKVNEYEGQHR
ncbi:MAG: hypothetical protein M3203_00825 [Actinomycetota bacterium]|nr:hypothetical protein [Actinomycetota bacterium]